MAARSTAAELACRSLTPTRPARRTCSIVPVSRSDLKMMTTACEGQTVSHNGGEVDRRRAGVPELDPHAARTQDLLDCPGEPIRSEDDDDCVRGPDSLAQWRRGRPPPSWRAGA